MINSLHYIGYLLGLTQPTTETTSEERACLEKYANNKRKLVEIGVSHGVNAKIFRSVMKEDGVYIAVDPYIRFFFGIRGYGWARRIAHAEVNKVKRGSVVWVEDLGENAAHLPTIRHLLPIDFVFVDGDHSYEGLKGDWKAWSTNIVPGGIIALHDSRNRDNCGSERYTNEVILKAQNFTVVDKVDSLTVLKRTL